MNRILSAALFFPVVAHAATTTFVCNYPTFSSFKGLEKVSQRFELTFIIDNTTHKAYIVGNNGSNEVTAMRSGEGITFIEITGGGNVMTTTIDQKMVSAHSRNTVVLGGDLLPSQYYGKCVSK